MTKVICVFRDVSERALKMGLLLWQCISYIYIYIYIYIYASRNPMIQLGGQSSIAL